MDQIEQGVMLESQQFDVGGAGKMCFPVVVVVVVAVVPVVWADWSGQEGIGHGTAEDG